MARMKGYGKFSIGDVANKVPETSLLFYIFYFLAIPLVINEIEIYFNFH